MPHDLDSFAILCPSITGQMITFSYQREEQHKLFDLLTKRNRRSETDSLMDMIPRSREIGNKQIEDPEPMRTCVIDGGNKASS